MFLIMTASAVRSSSSGLNHRNSVPGSFDTGTCPNVEGVADLENLITVGVPCCHLALEDVAPMRALAAVVRKPLHEGRRVDVFEERREAHGVAVELVAQIHHRTGLLALWRVVP
jgi:hypothetical protein